MAVDIQKLKIAVVEKCPSRVDYARHFGFEVKQFQLSSVKVTRLLKKDVDLEGFDPKEFDWVILVGSEALKEFTKETAVTNLTGKQVLGKCGYTNFLCSISPAMLAFKPENKPIFDSTVESIWKALEGSTVAKAPCDYESFQSSTKIHEYLRYVLEHKEWETIALDTETTSLYCRNGYVLGISMSHKTHQGVYMDADYFDELAIMYLQQIIDERTIVFHNAKFDMHMLTYHFGFKFDLALKNKKFHDTIVLHYLLDERQGTHGLKALAMKYTDMGDYDKALDDFKKDYCKAYGIKQEQFTYDKIPFDVISEYAAADTDATLRLFYKFWPILKINPKILSCYEDLMLPGLFFLTRMEDRGIPVSKERLLAARALMEAELFELNDQLYQMPEVQQLEMQQGAKFNPNSTKQLRVLLFDIVGLQPTGKKTGTGAESTDAEVLTDLSSQHPVPNLILKVRQKSKLKNTYIDKLIPAIDSDHKVRTNFNITSTTSGRLSSSGKFNMQQLPRDDGLIKGCIVAPPGYKIVALDLTTAEVYYAAVLSGDKALLNVFVEMTVNPDTGADFHSTIAHMVFHLTCEPREVKKLYPALRQAAKAITFGILFGSGPRKVAETVSQAMYEDHIENGTPLEVCTADEAKEYIKAYFTRFPRLKAWIDECHTQIRDKGFIYSWYGRKRRLRNIRSSDKGVASGEIRSGFNAVIQSASSDSLLMGSTHADLEIVEKGLDASIFALVHDSIVAVVREDLVEEYTEIVCRNVQAYRGLGIKEAPVGVAADSEDGGSRDYSCGKLDEQYPTIAAIFEQESMELLAV